MKKLLKRWIKRFFVKLNRWSKNNAFNPKRPLTKNESLCIAICRRLINHADSKFLIAPVSQRRYIKNQTLNLFVVLEENQVSITNHVYHYDVNLTESEYRKLRKLYDLKTESIRQNYEDEIKSQIVHSLSTILEKIS